MRILFSSTAGSGHFNPLVPFIDAAIADGDEVLVAGPPNLEPTLVSRGYPYRLGADPAKEEADAIWRRFPTVPKDEAAVLANREFFGRLCTAAMLPAVEEVCREWQPDLVLRDPCEFSSAVAGTRLGIPHAQADVLGQAAALVCHGGSGTTFGALAAGVPMVFVPLFADQPVNARLVSAAGAGVTVAPSGGPEGTMGVPGPQDSARLRTALRSVLDDHSYRAAAQGIAAEMAAMPSIAGLLAGLKADLVPSAR